MIPSRLVLCIAATLATGPARAHFQELIPSSDVLPQGGTVDLSLVFTHPFDRGPVMQMLKPVRFGMLRDGVATDLTSSLTETPIDGVMAWATQVAMPEPGAAVFYVEPQPYWEPAEGKFIVHYAKVVVDSWASGQGWDAPVGLPVEIQPLTRPTGLWTGNSFHGLVLKDGKPVPFAEIEVEWVNDGSVAAPNEAFITQVIKADASGAFVYTMPRAGWWGFAALLEGERPMVSPEGAEVPVEEGALIWVKATDMAGQ